MKRETKRGLVTLALRGISLVALVGTLSSATGCQGEGLGNEYDEAQCPASAGTVVLVNSTGKPIQELQIWSLDGEQTQSLVHAQYPLPHGAEVSWADCFGGSGALVVTLAGGTQEQHELPALDPSTNRLRMNPNGITIEPPPAPKGPSGRDLGGDGSNGSVQPRR
jgi:hypothetical protein